MMKHPKTHLGMHCFRVRGYLGVLTDVLVSGLGDDERAPARLLRDPVVVDLPVERVAVLLPAVSAKRSWHVMKSHAAALHRSKSVEDIPSQPSCHLAPVWGRVRNPVRLSESMHFSTHCWRAHSFVAGHDESHGLGKMSRGE